MSSDLILALSNIAARRRGLVNIKYVNNKHFLWFSHKESEISIFYCIVFSSCVPSPIAFGLWKKELSPHFLFCLIREARCAWPWVGDFGTLATLRKVGWALSHSQPLWQQDTSPSGVAIGLLGLGMLTQAGTVSSWSLCSPERVTSNFKKLLIIFNPIKTQMEGFLVKAGREKHFSSSLFFFPE